MKSTNKGFMLRGISIPLALMFLLIINLLCGCGVIGDAIDSLKLASFGEANKDKPSSFGSANADEPEQGDLLALVNPWNPIDPDYVPELDTLSDGTQVDERCIDALRELLDACRDAGNAPYICSAYRTMETQSYLFENKVSRLIDAGLSTDDARREAAREVAYPGTSEHQLGLAFDNIDSGYTALDEGQASTSTQLWLMDNSWRYGFILRYPEGKSEITGIIYEPWHYRYVGKEAAADIYESGLCFEEWLEAR